MPLGLSAVPSAQLPTNYQALIKLALRPRQKRTFLLAFVSLHISLSLSLLNPKAVFNFIPLLGSVAAFALALIPLLIARKRELSSFTGFPGASVTTRAEQTAALLCDRSTSTRAGIHAAAFGILAALHCLTTTGWRGVESDWAPQTWIPSHNAHYVNERFLFLIGSCAFLGALYGGAYLSWPTRIASPITSFPIGVSPSGVEGSLRHRVTHAFNRRVPVASLGGGCAGLGLFITYLLIRKTLWRTVLLLVGHRGIARRVLVPSFRADFPQADVAVRVVVVGAAVTAAVETAYVLLDVYLSQPIAPVTKFTKDPNRVLAAGLSDPTLFFSHHAYSELAYIAAADNERRISVFKDVHAERSAWSVLSSECLGLIEAERINVASRGVQPRQPDPLPPKASGTQADVAPRQSSDPTVWDALANGQMSVHPSSSVPKPVQPVSVRPAPASSTQWSGRAIASSIATTTWKLLPPDARHALCPPKWRFYLFEPSMRAKVVNMAGRDSRRLACAITAVNELLQHSLEEDPFGSVQKDIQKALQAFAGLSVELRALRNELEAEAAMLDDKLAREEAAAQTATGSESNADQAAGGGAASFRVDNTRQAQDELSDAWESCGAAMNEALLRTAIKGVLDTFARFHLEFEPELQARLSTCLEENGHQSVARWTHA
ncbi:hypothetical protein ACQY0O_003364 [Thecaphora frezii]